VGDYWASNVTFVLCLVFTRFLLETGLPLLATVLSD